MSLIKCPDSHRELLRNYESHLLLNSGLTAGSANLRTWHAARFLAARYGDGAPDLQSLSPRNVSEYITGVASQWSPNTRKNAVGTLRSFLRWLHMCGLCDSKLADSVPTVSCMKHSGIPAHISQMQLDELLGSFDLSKPTGLRGYAAALCMVRLGLRVGEAARLTLDDIDWKGGTICLPKTKGRRHRILPLPHAVGAAIIAYLRKGRPPTSERHIFVTHRSCKGKPPCREALRGDILHAFDRAGLKTPSKGTRVLRHTAATHMIRSGATIKEIADVLGHSSIDTTCIYAKVDFPALAELVAHWPKEVTA